LLNDVTYVETARKLAERVMRETVEPDDRLLLAFRRVTARPPTGSELSVLRRSLDRNLAEYRGNRASAAKLLQVGEAKPDVRLDAAELAAYATVCRLILNLDEAVTRE
jgi:hypothetical protein